MKRGIVSRLSAAVCPQESGKMLGFRECSDAFNESSFKRGMFDGQNLFRLDIKEGSMYVRLHYPRNQEQVVTTVTPKVSRECVRMAPQAAR